MPSRTTQHVSIVEIQRALIAYVHLVSALMAETGVVQGIMSRRGLLEWSPLGCGPLFCVSVTTFSVPTTQLGTSLAG